MSYASSALRRFSSAGVTPHETPQRRRARLPKGSVASVSSTPGRAVVAPRGAHSVDPLES
jgi:hypothetical protein